jgi:hypothetical protein
MSLKFIIFGLKFDRRTLTFIDVCRSLPRAASHSSDASQYCRQVKLKAMLDSNSSQFSFKRCNQAQAPGSIMGST